LNLVEITAVERVIPQHIGFCLSKPDDNAKQNGRATREVENDVHYIYLFLKEETLVLLLNNRV
jgi:hypothetical protein